MPFTPFELERWQSTWEHRVRINLSESGVHPMSIGELLELSGGDLTELANIRMGYAQGDGSDQLRAMIAELYPGATDEQVTVTTGSSEANFITCWALIEPGDRVVILTPTYMQTWGLAQNFGAEVATIDLVYERAWEPDPETIARAITPETKLVVVTNPNNPTGHVLTPATCDAIVDCARAAGAWLLADEVYRGAELNGVTTPSFWGEYEKLIIVSGFSKAYGLPGLRIGWTVGPPEFKEAVVKRHDYTVICPSPATDYLARQALSVREQILERTREILNTNYPIFSDWLGQFDEVFEWQRPDCGAICFVRYHHPVSALDLVERIRSELSILLVPGEHFALPRHLRFGYGNELNELETALRELKPALTRLLQ